MVWTIIIIGIAITLAVLVLSIMTVSKGYSYKHSVDPIVEKESEVDILVKKTEE